MKWAAGGEIKGEILFKLLEPCFAGGVGELGEAGLAALHEGEVGPLGIPLRGQAASDTGSVEVENPHVDGLGVEQFA